MEKTGFESWAIVELMGHTRIAGKVTEAEIGGGKLLRVDVPAVGDKQPLTKYFGTVAIYAITPVDEETALMAAQEITTAPVSEWSARELLKRSDAAKALNPPKPVVLVDTYEPHDDDDENDDTGF